MSSQTRRYYERRYGIRATVIGLTAIGAILVVILFWGNGLTAPIPFVLVAVCWVIAVVIVAAFAIGKARDEKNKS